MRNTITISIPKEVKRQLDEVIREEGVSRSDVIRESLRDYLWAKRFRSLRRKLMKKAQTRGIYTDQDVFDRVS